MAVIEVITTRKAAIKFEKPGPEPISLTVPPDPFERTIRIKVIGLTGHGAIDVKLDSKPLNQKTGSTTK